MSRPAPDLTLSTGFLTVAALAFGAGLLSGCSDDLGTNPNGPTSESDPPTLPDGNEESADDDRRPTFELPEAEALDEDDEDGGDDEDGPDDGDDGSSGDPTPELPDQVPDFVGDLIGDIDPGTQTLHIDPSSGGAVEQSVFRLDVPAGALNSAATVQMTVESANQVKVHLGPDGLQFTEPAELFIDLSEIVGTLSGPYSMFWWDPDAEEWVNIGGDWDPETRILRAAIWHFSDYAPGRAGWNSGGGKKPADSEQDDKK